VSFAPVVVCLPTEDRVASHTFYRDVLGLRSFGAPAPDGVPEPLQIAVNDGLHLIFIPTGGFGWVIGGNEVATPGNSECMLVINLDSDSEVDDLINRVREGGARIAAEPTKQPWGIYSAVFADPDGHLWSVQSGTMITGDNR
jgi:predicted lactoylglutathione lyase